MHKRFQEILLIPRNIEYSQGTSLRELSQFWDTTLVPKMEYYLKEVLAFFEKLEEELGLSCTLLPGFDESYIIQVMQILKHTHQHFPLLHWLHIVEYWHLFQYLSSQIVVSYSTDSLCTLQLQSYELQHHR